MHSQGVDTPLYLTGFTTAGAKQTNHQAYSTIELSGGIQVLWVLSFHAMSLRQFL
jgi:hypothetical protein